MLAVLSHLAVFLDLLWKLLVFVVAAGLFVWGFDRITAWIVAGEQELDS